MQSAQLKTIAIPAAADLTGKAGYAMKVDSSGDAAVQASAGAAYAGVLVANPTIPDAVDEPASIALKGQMVQVSIGAAVSPGFGQVDANGQFIAYSSGQYACVFLESGDAVGQLIDAILL